MKKQTRQKPILIALSIILTILIAYTLYIGYWYYHPAKIQHTLYVDVLSTSSEDYEQNLLSRSAKKVYIHWTHANAIPFNYLGQGENRSRDLTLYNPYEFPVEVELTIDGEITPMLTISEAPVQLQPEETKTIQLNIAVPEGTTEGEYIGILTLNFIRQ